MRRVLVVDDEENIRVVLKTLLKRHGFLHERERARPVVGETPALPAQL